MMPNPKRGEVVVQVNGAPHLARLTLGALAALEAEIGAQSLEALLHHFERGAPSARDIYGLLRAGLQGAGWANPETQWREVDFGTPQEAARAAARLLAAAFGGRDARA